MVNCERGGTLREGSQGGCDGSEEEDEDDGSRRRAGEKGRRRIVVDEAEDVQEASIARFL